MKNKPQATIFTDEALTQAAGQVCQAMLGALPEAEDRSVTLSAAFEQRMHRLIARLRRRQAVRKALQRVAVLFLVLFVGLSAWLAFDAEARNSFFSWIGEVLNGSVIYHSDGAPTAAELPLYRPAWLPEGYAEASRSENAMGRTILYMNTKDEDGVFFACTYIQTGRLELFTDPTECELKQVTVNGLPADFYQAIDPEDSNNLVWIDQETGITFSLQAHLGELDMLHIAESVCLEE